MQAAASARSQRDGQRAARVEKLERRNWNGGWATYEIDEDCVKAAENLKWGDELFLASVGLGIRMRKMTTGGSSYYM